MLKKVILSNYYCSKFCELNQQDFDQNYHSKAHIHRIEDSEKPQGALSAQKVANLHKLLTDQYFAIITKHHPFLLHMFIPSGHSFKR